MSGDLIQRSFAGGEIAPALYGRADQVKYQTGLKKARNFVILKHGGAGMRGGTEFIAEVKTSSLATYLAKFVFNNDQTYVIEAGNQYFRFIRDGAQIVVSGVAAYNGATAYEVSDLVSSAGVNYYCIAATTGNAPPNATYWYALTGDIYEIPTPYVTADLSTLQLVQSGDVVTIVHPSYAPRDLTRAGHTDWTLAGKAFAPGIIEPPSISNSGAAGTGGDAWVVTAVAAETYEESVASSSTETSATATSGAPILVSWTAVAGAQEYNVYKRNNGIYGFIGAAASNSFSDNGRVADMSQTPPIARNPFATTDYYPSCVTYYQQRLMFANQNADTEKIFASRSGMFENFTTTSPLQPDDAVTFRIAGRQVNAVRHMLDLGILVVLTQSGEWLIEGDASGALAADQPANPRQIGYSGASPVPPVVVSDSIVFLQARASVLRDLRYTVESGGGSASYKGRDLTVYAGHLFLNKTITRLDYAQNRNSVVWGVRSDGVMLGMTYLTDHEIWGWHQHDTDGTIEDVCVVPEGEVDAEYLIVNRTINGATKRYIERMSSRDFTDIEVDARFLDSFLTYDGRNTGATTVTLSTGATWTVDDLITVTAAAGTPFVAGDVGNDIVVWSGDDEVRIRVSSYTSNIIVEGYPDKTVPAALRSTALTTWGRAVDALAGLDHLEAKDVAVFADGNVVASPNNSDYTTITVSGGTITLDTPYLLIHVGLPFIADLQTLDIDIEGQQIRGSRKNITGIKLLVESSRGIFVGPDEDNLDEMMPEPIPNYGEPWPLITGVVEAPLASTWNESGSLLIRQVDPLPLTILSAIPSGDIGG